MRFSIHLPNCTEGLVNPVPFAEPADFVRIAREAERLGYDAVWGNDHVTAAPYVRTKWADPPNFYEVLITLATVGAHTERVQLGTAVLVLPLRDPVLVAKQAATLDRLTGGRLILGVGIGAYREEFLAQWPRRAAARRGDLLDEGLEALRLLFTEREASFAGRHHVFEKVELFPKPWQRPLPIYVGGHNEAAVARAARLGQGWLPGWRPFEEVNRGGRPRSEGRGGRGTVHDHARSHAGGGRGAVSRNRHGPAPPVARPLGPRSRARRAQQPDRQPGEHPRAAAVPRRRRGRSRVRAAVSPRLGDRDAGQH